MNKNELMTYVEKIVRPVRANQLRKLKMRRELLSHLESAFEEERGHIADDVTALDAAQRRLGTPGNLTVEFQKSVPFIERLLHSGTPKITNGWEHLAYRRMGIEQLPTTLAQWLILYGAAAIALILAMLCVPRVPGNIVVQKFIEHQMKFTDLLFVTGIFLQFVWAVLGMRYLGATIFPAGKFSIVRLLWRGSAVLVLQAIWISLLVVGAMDRLPTALEMIRSLGVTALAMAAVVPAGRWVALLRVPYDEWFSLVIT